MVDDGGGIGSVSIPLAQFPHLKLVFQDLPGVIKEAKEVLFIPNYLCNVPLIIKLFRYGPFRYPKPLNRAKLSSKVNHLISR